MFDITKIDSNFKVETNIAESNIRFFDVRQEPFRVYGLSYEDGQFRRLPKSVAKTVSEGVYALHTNTAGGRVRFKTDSKYIVLFAKMPNIGRMEHFALTGSAGLDMYVSNDNGKEMFVNSFRPPLDIQDSYEGIIYFDEPKLREITINFPLYSSVSEMYIGLQEAATVCAPDDYAIEKPIVFYGSSITQGACASRPGNAYESIVSRRLDCNYINLGFSGNAKGEDAIAEYISNLDMSVFVYDYDYNAPNVEHLKSTHKKMFDTIRAKHPQLPIILLSRPKFSPTAEEKQRLDVIRETYNAAKANGDNNVYLLDGKTLMALCGNDGTVDGVHPNDWGFASMAKAVGDLLETNILPNL